MNGRWMRLDLQFLGAAEYCQDPKFAGAAVNLRLGQRDQLTSLLQDLIFCL